MSYEGLLSNESEKDSRHFQNANCKQSSRVFSRSTAIAVSYIIYTGVYRIAGIIRGGIISALFAVEFHPRKINPRNIAGE